MKWRRRKYFIQPGFQSRVISRFILVVSAMIILTMAITVAFYAYQTKKETGQYFYVTDQVGSDPKVVDRTKIVLPALITAAAVGVVLTGIFGLFFSHRLAGPAYKIQKTIEQHLQGEKVNPIILRKNDEFKDLAEAINKLLVKFLDK
ncbi:MAG: hypothetical protein A2474_08725 [Elusimicrobia bacterium RIFOXYC2_FULL_34_12]|nr:MAG: hypothetical protein A2474_08725 [Elusimicrobia bacterium RIFOXYC2_FULL_34_12]OGS47295.1 MAG: hypothetical protein A2539_07335 [Elusimicrobia bacterium RIFOXYD2_FULL_34_15]